MTMGPIEKQTTASLPRPAISGTATAVVSKGLGRGLFGIMAVAAAVVNANMYYSQPLLADMARDFHVSAGPIGWVPMLTQIGCAAGVLLIAPLGDVADRRRIVMVMCGLAVVALLGVAAAPNFGIVALASFALGTSSIVPQLLIPFAAHLAPPGEQGRAAGTVLSGLLIGMLLGRTISGFVGQQLGWRAMYWIAGGLMLLIAVLLIAWLPKTRPGTELSYGRLLLSLEQLLVKQPVLRETALTGAMLFGAFSAFWATLIFLLESSPYHYGSRAAGLFGILGIVGASAASVVGRWADRREPRRLTFALVMLCASSYLLFWAFNRQLWALIGGVILLDLGVQGGSICNHARNYRLLPDATNRAATIYITSLFLGGSVGTKVATFAWQHWGYPGVCFTGMALLLVAGTKLLLPLSKSRRVISVAEGGR